MAIEQSLRYVRSSIFHNLVKKAPDTDPRQERAADRRSVAALEAAVDEPHRRPVLRIRIPEHALVFGQSRTEVVRPDLDGVLLLGHRLMMDEDAVVHLAAHLRVVAGEHQVRVPERIDLLRDREARARVRDDDGDEPLVLSLEGPGLFPRDPFVVDETLLDVVHVPVHENRDAPLPDGISIHQAQDLCRIHVNLTLLFEPTVEGAQDRVHAHYKRSNQNPAGAGFSFIDRSS